MTPIPKEVPIPWPISIHRVPIPFPISIHRVPIPFPISIPKEVPTTKKI